MASTPRSRKAKGRRLQNDIRDRVRNLFPDLHPDDVTSCQMGGTGTDIKLSPAARKKFPYSVECKNVEKLNVWSAIQQAEDNTVEDTTPVVFIKKNNTEVYAVIPADHFFTLLGKSNE